MNRKIIGMFAIAVMMGAGCGGSSLVARPASYVEGGDSVKGDVNSKEEVKAVAKNCEVQPPANDVATTTNASGKVINTQKGRIYTSEQALPKLWEAAKQFASDAVLVGGYNGSGNAIMPTDPFYRAHYGSVRGAVWAWSGTFYSPSKNENVYLAYIDGEAGGSIPQITSEQTAKYYQDNAKFLKIYADYGDMISSCQVYEIAKANGYDDFANYPIILSGDQQTTKKYPGRKIWVLEERSRTDTDNGKEIMGKTMNVYAIDAVTGEFLEKREGVTYSF